MNEKKLKVKKSKKKKSSSLQILHGAFKDLLSKDNAKQKIFKTNSNTQSSRRSKMSDEKLRSLLTRKRRSNKGYGPPVSSGTQNIVKNGTIYIKSKENQSIPNLTDDDVLLRHKKADAKMKQVWTDIIDKYEHLDDEGDEIDLQTMEIVKNNGHIQGLQNVNTTADYSDTSRPRSIRYVSTLNDIIDINEHQKYGDEYSIWQESGDDEDDADFVVTDNKDSEESEDDST